MTTSDETPTPVEVEFRAYWEDTGRLFREMPNALADYQAGFHAGLRRALYVLESEVIFHGSKALVIPGLRQAQGAIRQELGRTLASSAEGDS